MAVDTERKRWGMMQWASGPAYYPTLFNPDTSGVDATERATLLKLYGGIAWEAISIVLSNATQTDITQTTATLGVTTDTACGTIYFYVAESGDAAPDAATIVSGAGAVFHGTV